MSAPLPVGQLVSRAGPRRQQRRKRAADSSVRAPEHGKSTSTACPSSTMLVPSQLTLPDHALRARRHRRRKAAAIRNQARAAQGAQAVGRRRTPPRASPATAHAPAGSAPREGQSHRCRGQALARSPYAPPRAAPQAAPVRKRPVPMAGAGGRAARFWNWRQPGEERGADEKDGQSIGAVGWVAPSPSQPENGFDGEYQRCGGERGHRGGADRIWHTPKLGASRAGPLVHTRNFRARCVEVLCRTARGCNGWYGAGAQR